MNSIGVSIPTYNRPNELRALLRSLPAGVAAWVSDNGALLPPEFRQEFPDVQFKSLPGAPVGMFANWNSAARMATTDWVLVPSDDDIYYADSFDRIGAALDAHPSAGIVVFGHHVVGDAYEIVASWCPEAAVLRAPHGFEPFKRGVHARMPAIAFRRTALEELGYFDERYVYAASDSDLVQRALLAYDAVYVPEIVAGYRVWQQGATRTTLATPGWLADIEYWGSKMERLLRAIPEYAGQARQVREELYASNLLAGLGLLRRQGASAECRAHFRRSRFPLRARWTTQLRILYQVVRTLRA